MKRRHLALFTGLALVASLLVLGNLLFAATPTQAASFLVTNAADDGPGSLRQAILAANDQSGQDVISFHDSLQGQIIQLSSGALNIGDDVVIRGPGAPLLSLRGDGLSSLLRLESGVVITVQAITLEQAATAISATTSVQLQLSQSVIRDNGRGLTLGPNSTVVISQTVLSGNRDGALIALEANGEIDESLISGNGADQGGGLFLSGSGLWRLEDSIVSGNQASLNGGGILVTNGAALQVFNSEIVTNRAPFGAGLANLTGTVRLQDSLIAGNDSTHRGGGIYHFSPLPLDIQNSLILDNRALWGGGLYIDHGPVSLTGCAVAGNLAQDGVGGGLYAGSGRTTSTTVVTLTNCTLSGNRATWNGGGIGMGIASFQLRNVTVFGNQADSDQNGDGDGGGIAQFGESSLQLDNSIIAGNVDTGEQAPDCAEIETNGVGVLSQGHNIIQAPGNCTVDAADSDQFGSNPQLDPRLQDNGGDTLTHALQPDSPAIDAGDCSGGLVTVDQRGISRAFFAPCDIGAFERAGAVLWLPVIAR